MRELSKKLGEMAFDSLITGLTPAVQVGGGTIAKLAAAAVFPRGALLGKADGTGLLSLYDGTTTPDCILCDETSVGTESDETVAVYTGGCFDPEKLTAAAGYTLTEADKDKLRERGIVLKAASAAL